MPQPLFEPPFQPPFEPMQASLFFLPPIPPSTLEGVSGTRSGALRCRSAAPNRSTEIKQTPDERDGSQLLIRTMR